ncbi:hypothetical protein R83H12_02274 [Fibrobacteria bacterium R8-3-H12]
MPSSSSVAPSSSSSAELSSSSIEVVEDGCPNVSIGSNSMTCGNQTYRTVSIGGKVWMAENLNYNASGSKCYNNQDSYCAQYGRLYNWATAMGIPSSYNNNSYNPSDSVKYRGVCPQGWHLPNDADWDALYRYADNTSGTSIRYSSPNAGWYLKATSGWNEDGDGEDMYGFSALPGGNGNSSGRFSDAGLRGYWWAASENIGNTAYHRRMYYNENYAYYSNDYKSSLFSVRCVQDNSSLPQTGITYGTPVDYEGETYETVKIGEQTWFKRNLNYNAEGSKCYGDLDSNCTKYGRLYDWATAMGIPSSYNSSSYNPSSSVKYRGVCPPGWHLPNNAEWDALYGYADGTSGMSSPHDSRIAGRKLKAQSGWSDCGPSGSGNRYVCEDAFGFSAMPGSGIGPDVHYANYTGSYGYWWSASEYEYDDEDDSDYAYYRLMDYLNESARYKEGKKSNLFSIRCVKD